jgi:hypothetical protein
MELDLSKRNLEEFLIFEAQYKKAGADINEIRGGKPLRYSQEFII